MKVVADQYHPYLCQNLHHRHVSRQRVKIYLCHGDDRNRKQGRKHSHPFNENDPKNNPLRPVSNGGKHSPIFDEHFGRSWKKILFLTGK